MTSRVWPFVTCAVLLLGCHPKPALRSAPPEEPRPARSATVRHVVFEEAVRRVEVDARDEEERPSPDALAHAREEYRRVLWREVRAIAGRIDDLEHELEAATADDKPDKQRELDDARAWRTLLRNDLELVGGVTASRWSAVKRRIARHLEDQRPTSFPTWAEKSFGI